MGYTHEYSNFPDEVMPIVRYKNVDDYAGNIINQIEQARQSGNYLAAAQLINQYAEQLKPYNLDATLINSLIENIRNAQIRSMTAGQMLSIDEAEPIDPDDGFVWIGGY